MFLLKLTVSSFTYCVCVLFFAENLLTLKSQLNILKDIFKNFIHSIRGLFSTSAVNSFNYTYSVSINAFFHTSIYCPCHPVIADVFEGKWFHGLTKHFVAWLHFQTHWIIYRSFKGSNLVVVLFLKASQGTTEKH